MITVRRVLVVSIMSMFTTVFFAHSEEAFILMPDLVVVDVSSPNLDSGVIKVRVKNQGNAPSKACYMAIRVTPPGENLKVFSPQVLPLGPGQVTTVQANTQMLLSQADFEAIVDRSNTVVESNERNNRLVGKFGGKP